MDISLISQAGTAISLAKELTKAAIGIRDFNQVATVVAKINDQLLKAQEALFTHNTQLFELQERHRQAVDELRQVKEILAERGRYQLHELSQGVFVYRFAEQGNAVQEGGNAIPKPAHYMCQPCFDKGVKAVLIRFEVPRYVSHKCPSCETQYLEFRKPSKSVRRTSPGWLDRY